MVLFLIILVLFIAHMLIVSEGPLREKFLSNPQLSEVVGRLDELHSRLRGIPVSPQKNSLVPEGSVIPQEAGGMIALYFKDGSVIEGELLSKTKDEYVVNWGGKRFAVYTKQVERVEQGIKSFKDKELLTDQEITGQWAYQNDIVIRLTNNLVLDAEIIKVDKDKLTLLYPVEGGGRIEQDMERSRVEYLIFKPVDNKESRKIENYLKDLFPKMKFYKEGNFTIVTDSYITWVKEYRKAIRGVYTDIYLNFFDLFKDRKQKVQNFLVIFDEFSKYVEYALTDGVPGWAAVGYFSPEDEVLYLFNGLGDKFSQFLFEAFVGETGKEIDEIAEKVGDRVGDRYQVFIDGQAKVIKDKFWEAYTYYKSIFREMTMNTLRHESCHEVFHNWGLQNIILSRQKDDKTRLIKKKKEFLETKDCKKKASLIRTLVSSRGEPLDMQAANSWLGEGTATYCATDPIGSRDDMWLFLYQDMARQGPIYPLESLTFYKMGSFPGVCSKAQLYLYAQSWAYFTFLMERYPKEFMAYQKRMAEEVAQEQEDIKWLAEALGKDLKVVEKEFVEFMNSYEEVDDPDVSHFEKMYSIFRD